MWRKFILKITTDIFYKTAAFFLIFVIIMVFTSGVLLYINFEKSSISNIQAFVKDNLQQVSYSSNIMNDCAKTLAMQIYCDTSIKRLLVNYDVDSIEMSEAVRQLLSYSNSAPYSHSIYVYNKYTRTFYSTVSGSEMQMKEEFVDKEIVEMIDHIDDYSILKPIVRIIPSGNGFQSGAKTTVYSYLFYGSEEKFGDEKNVIVVNVLESWFRDTIYALNEKVGGDILIIDKDGKTVVNSDTENVLEDISGTNYVTKILKSKDETGYFIETIEGKKQMVAYLYARDKKWCYISIVPYHIITNKIFISKAQFVIIILLFTLLMIAVYLIIAKKVYKKANIFIKSWELLLSDKTVNLHYLRQEFLINVVKGSRKYTESEFDKNIRQLEIKFDLSRSFVMVMLKISNYKQFCNESSIKEANLIRYGITNIAEELFMGQSIDMGSDHMIILINTDAGEYDIDFQNNLNKSIHNFAYEVKKIFNVSFHISVSSIGETIYDVSEIYSQLLEISLYHLFREIKDVVYYNEIALNDSQAYKYPLDKEKTLVSNIIAGNMEDVNDIFLYIIDNASQSAYHDFYTTIVRVASAVSGAINALEKNSNVNVTNGNLDKIIFDFSGFETIEGIKACFIEIFNDIKQQLSSCKDPRYDDIVGKMLNSINKNYTDPGFSIKSIGYELNMSSIYIGRIFKSYTGKSVANYVLELRIEKTIELFSQSNNHINVIAEKAGFLNFSYYCTVFKKIKGISPAEYRRNLS